MLKEGSLSAVGAADMYYNMPTSQREKYHAS